MFLILALFAVVAAAPFDPFSLAKVEEHPGAQVPMATVLTDSTSARRDLAAITAGRPVFLVPVLHDCPNLCGVTLDGMVSAMDTAGIRGNRDVAVIAFGIDPGETPQDAARALAQLAERHPGTAGRIHAVVADAAAVHAVTDPLGYRFAYDPRIRQYAHAAAVAVLTPDGRFSRWLYGLAPDPAELKAALAEAKAGKTGGWSRRLILLCYHYDPVTGRYSLAIDWLLRGLGALTVAGLLLFIALTRRRERVRPS